jgi:hypothetical protein
MPVRRLLEAGVRYRPATSAPHRYPAAPIGVQHSVGRIEITLKHHLQSVESIGPGDIITTVFIALN